MNLINNMEIKMSNEEYRRELNKVFQNIDNNDVLKHFYILIVKLIEEW